MMNKKMLFPVLSVLMALSLVLAACTPATPTASTSPPTTPTTTTPPATPTTPTATAAPAQSPAAKQAPEAPKYGGTVTTLIAGDITNFDSIGGPPGASPITLSNETLWSGDWARGPAGGYGTGETDWTLRGDDLFAYKTGYIAESTKWTVDPGNKTGTIVYEIRQGMHYALNPASEASRLVGGREVTADDVVAHLKRTITDPTAYIYKTNPELKTANITKTGPWEVTIHVPIAGLITGVSRFGDSTQIQPQEVIQKYGNMSNWKNLVGSGAFMLTDYVGGSQLFFSRNDNYWMKDPVGPGKGNQLPYLDSVRFLIIPDKSTQQAALRTGKIDELGAGFGLGWEDAAAMKKAVPALQEIEIPAQGGPTYIRIDKPPLNDLRVRQAMMMSIDLESIRQNLDGGLGQISTFPFNYTKAYAPLYIDPNAPDVPASVKALFVYNPDRAKQLLTEAGYPNGFKTSIVVTSADVDYYSIYKDMWAKVGIDLSINVMDAASLQALLNNNQQQALSDSGWDPYGTFYTLPTFYGNGYPNVSDIFDPTIDSAMANIRLAAITDMSGAMTQMRSLIENYILGQVTAIPTPKAPTYAFWWPWLKNYSGEQFIGYINIRWPQWVWVDQTMKKNMGY